MALVRMQRLKAIGGWILAVLALIIVFQNTESIDTQVLFFTFPVPRALLVFVALAIGYLAGALRVGRRRT